MPINDHLGRRLQLLTIACHVNQRVRVRWDRSHSRLNGTPILKSNLIFKFPKLIRLC